MPKPKKSWREKLRDNKGLPRTGPIDGRISRRWGEGTMVIPAPLEVDALMRKVPRGRLTTVDELRGALARKHGVTIACPLTTGIFAWIAAHAAAEDEAGGVRNFTPWWRTLKTGGELNPKYPGGSAETQRRLAAEGHRILRKGERRFVEDFENKIAAPG